MTEKWYDEAVAERLKRIQERIDEACIRAGRHPEEVTLLAVTKTVGEAPIRAAIAAGVTHVGENRVQEWQQKQTIWDETGVQVHLIGHLQRNKVRQVVGKVACIESVDSVRLAETIETVAAACGVTVPILCEINIGKEESKSGIAPEEAEETVSKIAAFPHLRVEGLMTVPPISDSSTKKREYFAQMHKLFLDIRGKMLDNRSMNILSMGMSSDFEEAIAEGSTQVRLGTALFGQRNYNIQ